MAKRKAPTPPKLDKRKWFDVPEGGHPMGVRLAEHLNEYLKGELQTSIPGCPLKIVYPSERYSGQGSMRALHKTDILKATADLFIIPAASKYNPRWGALGAFTFDYAIRPLDLKVARVKSAHPALEALDVVARKVTHAQKRCADLNASYWAYSGVEWRLDLKRGCVQPTANLTRPDESPGPADLRLCVVERKSPPLGLKKTYDGDVDDTHDGKDVVVCAGIIMGSAQASDIYHAEMGTTEPDPDVLVTSPIFDLDGVESRDAVLRNVMAKYVRLASGFRIAEDWSLSGLFGQNDLDDDDEYEDEDNAQN